MSMTKEIARFLLSITNILVETTFGLIQLFKVKTHLNWFGILYPDMILMD